MKRLLFTLSFCSLVSGIATGTPSVSAVSIPDSIDNNTQQLPDIEVLSKKERREISSATPFHKIDSKRILETGITDISDAIKRLPGVNLRDYGGAGGLKTVSVRGLGAQHTGISYDGVSLSDLRSGEIDLSRYSLNNISSLTLSAGDNDDIFTPARYISSSSVLSISTLKNPDLWDRSFELDARMKVGSFGLYNPFIKAGYSNGSNWSVSVLGEFFHAKNNYPFTLFNGDYTSKERRSNSQMNSVHTEANLHFSPNATSSLTAKLYYYDNSRQLPGPVIYYAPSSNEHLHDRNFFAQARYKAKLSSIFSIMGLGKFNWAASRYQDVDGIYPDGKLDQNYIQREGYASAALLCTPFAGWAFDYSADWIYNNLSSNLPTDRHPYRNSVLQSLSAKYTSDRFSATAKLLYSLFMDRAEGYIMNNQTVDALNNNANRLSPSVAVSFRPVNSVPFYLRASYKNIFRMPTFNELYFDNYGTISLKPEITNQWNIGTTLSLPSWKFINELSLIADVYINKVQDKIVAIPYNLFKWTMTNLEKARIYGLDLTINGDFTITTGQSILVDASYSYQRAQPRTSPDMVDWMKQIAYTPLNSGSASLSWLNPWVSIALHGTATSARYTTNANLPSTRIPGYADFGVSLFRSFPLSTGSIELRGDIMNIFNKQYQIVARYPMPGRSWAFSIRYNL